MENIKDEDVMKFTFHIHLPKGVLEKFGQPMVLGSSKELGFWRNPIVKLRQPSPQNPTYWQSESVIISLSNFNEINDIQYKYAFHGKDGNIMWEGYSSEDNRMLDIEKNDQFDIWKNNSYLSEKFDYNFAFVDYIYSTIKENNLKDKVMEYQHLLTKHKELTIRVSNLDFIFHHVKDKLKEKRLFLCLFLGYFITRQGAVYKLPNQFPSGLLLKALDGYKQETLPSNTKDLMYIAITSLIQHNAIQMEFDWLIIFRIAAEVDPNYNFIEHLEALKYPNEKLLAKFTKEVEFTKLYIKGIRFETYVKLAKWIIQLCYNLDSLHKLCGDILLHNSFYFFYKSGYFSKNISQYFIERVRNIHEGDIILSLEVISQSHNLNILNIFPEILNDGWYHDCFPDTETTKEKVQEICVNWFKLLLAKLASNENDFVYLVFQKLESMYPLFSQKINIWQDLTDIAIKRIKRCSETRIFAATKLIVQIKQDYVNKLFLDIVKEILDKTVQQIDDWLLNKIFIICDCKCKTLEIPNSMSEEILCYIMTTLQMRSDCNILKDNRFWNIILHATGCVEKLNSISFVKHAKMSISELDGLFPEKTIDLQLLQQRLVYFDERLFQQFDVAVTEKKALSDISQDKIHNLLEQKPSVYMISNSMINDIEFPFSYYFMNQINHYKNYYYKELDILEHKSENINYQHKELYEELVDDHMKDFRNNLISIYPNFENLQKYSELYYNDFIKIILSTHTKKLASKKQLEQLDFILRHLMGDKIVNDPFILHIYWWKYADNIKTQLKLIENFPDITEIQNDFIIYGKLDQYFFRRTIKLILQNICDHKPWKQDMNYILSVNDKINRSKKVLNLSNFDLLLICDDLLRINLMPLAKIKEMIYLGKSDENQEFITVDIINIVFNSLDNNNDIVPIRTFITRVLDLISLKSEVRLILYKNLFSREPFELIGIIIEKIFITEHHQNRRIFFKLIKNSKKILKLSNRLNTINNSIKNLNSDMGVLCCEIIQKILYKFGLDELSPYFKHSIESFTNQEDLSLQQTFMLQQITSIAFLKEFIYKYWKNYIQEDNSLSKSLIKEINEIMNISHSFIQSLKTYFVPNLYQKKIIDNTKQFKVIKEEFPWLESFTDERVPKIWKLSRKVNFEDFYAFYNSNWQNLEKYPFLSIYFKNYKQLKLINHLYPIVRFVKILNLKLEYYLTRKVAHLMKFHEFIVNESHENANLKTLFEEFAFGWNYVMDYFVQYQSKELPYNKSNKPIMNLELPVIYGLIDQKDAGIHLCTILDFLIKLHNEFLDNIIAIPVGKCKSLEFLKDLYWDTREHNIYFIKSIKIAQAQDINFINYEWNDRILKYSQKNLEMEDINFIFDLQKIEIKLVKKLVLNKVYFEMEDNQLYLKKFSFKHELFHNHLRIFFDIKKFLPQESIQMDTNKTLLFLAMFQPSNSLLAANSSFNSINLPDLLFLFEIIFYFIKELSVKNSELLISDFVNQWLKLTRFNSIDFINVLKKFSLKHIIAFYEKIEEQVANSVIHNIDVKFKVLLTQQMKDSINNIVDYYNLKNRADQLIPAKAFALSLKRFIYRYLLSDSNIETLSLNIYFLDFTLDLWTCDVEEELIEILFPSCLLVSHAYNTYNFITNEIKATVSRIEMVL
ncbi:hypothetical protein C1645_871114 [Glomus cerebriforme]|uniref:CBM20 domain-containing protein n=1 Tax=Glomus cerebriforme TaxID=658196 RepID=A0A397TLF4_9GLOM|nr:hypothetical protein C1645_871114 [Glomus cerebriforme]